MSMTPSIALLKAKAKTPGGLEKYTERLKKSFELKGANVTLVSPPLSRLPSFLRLEQADSYYKKWQKTHPVDIVFGMDRAREQTHLRAGNGVHAAYLAHRKPMESSLKSWFHRFNPLHQKILEIEKTAFESPRLKRIFANSHFVKNQILEYYAVDAEKIDVVHNGVEWDEMEADCSTFTPSSRFEFLFVGSGFSRKGLGLLLEGCKLLKEDFHLSVVGADKHMDLFKKQAEPLNDKVSFLGQVPNVRKFYQKSDALIIPSLYDPFANVTLEALAMGLYVVSSKYNGASEILTPQTGALIEELFTPESIADSLKKALSHKKTPTSLQRQRESVKHLQLSTQTSLIIESTFR